MRQYSWVPDELDFRDLKFSPHPETINKLPPSIDLRKKFLIVRNQGEMGSCTANAMCVGLDFTRIKEGLQPIIPSRLFLYYNERDMEGTPNEDSGAQIRDGMKSLATLGTCLEKNWIYNIKLLFKKPTPDLYTEALSHTLKAYKRLNNANIEELKSCLVEGFTFVFGFSVFESFESTTVAKTGIVPYPSTSEHLLGGHAVLAVGYDDNLQAFIVRNSWGISWGDHGHFYLPYSYITNTSLADDFWTMRIC